MSAAPAHPELARLRARLDAQEAVAAAQQAELAAQRGELARLRRRRRAPRRLAPLALVALLVALLPLSLLAAGPFGDLNAGSPHNGNIQAIADAGITRGCDPPAFVSYCPNGLVTREEMASFLARTAGLGGNPPVANALTAVSATNATNATNAAQLGGQPATYYQPAGQPIASATNAGNADKLGGVAAASYVQSSNHLLPIAYASVAADGTKRTGTRNVGITYGSAGFYIVDIAGEDYSFDSHIAVATAASGNTAVATLSTAKLDSGKGVLLVFTKNTAGALVDASFNVVVYKP